MLQIQLRHRKT